MDEFSLRHSLLCINELTIFSSPLPNPSAVSDRLETETIISVLNKLSKTKLPKEMIDFMHGSTANYGKGKLVLKKNRYVVESLFPEVLKALLSDEVISRARITAEGSHGDDGFTVSKTMGLMVNGPDSLLNEAELAAAAKEKETHSFEIDPSQVENVKQRCSPNALNYPMLEEYDFRNDTVNPDLDVELNPQAQPRPYQEKSLSKMKSKIWHYCAALWCWKISSWCFCFQPN